jgi:exo-beta-1,3-glucanase (GH17 family)
MWSKLSRSSLARLFLLGGACLLTSLIGGLSSQLKVKAQSLADPYPLLISPNQMQFSGDVTSGANCANTEVCSWLENTPAGTVLLGVDPTSSDPADWDGGTLTVDVSLPNIYPQTILVLKLSWPDREGKGLHSPQKNERGTITLDGKQLWTKRTTDLSTYNDYYAAEHEPILTALVLSQSTNHTLTISVTAHTAWDLSQIELTAYPYPTTIQGIGYSPYRDCQYPGGDELPSSQDISDDLFRLAHTTDAIRTYATTGANSQVAYLAGQIGLPMYAGAWIDYPKTTLAQDDAEIQALINQACTYSNIQGVIVGNEYYLRHRSSDAIDYLLQRINEVKTGISSQCGKTVPVTTAEIDDLLFNWEGDPPVSISGINSAYQSILDAVDYVMIHTYPFWSGMPIDGAAEYTIDRYLAARTRIEQEYPGKGKRVIIGETGWPSAGGSNGQAIPSQFNQRKYMLEFLPLAQQKNVDFFYFDAFDELWKVEEPGLVGQHWGYGYTDRAAKYSFYGVLIPSEELASPPAPLSHKIFLPLVAKGGTITMTFPVYTDWPEGPGRFIPSGWVGDIGNIEFYACDRCNPHEGEMAIRNSFTPGPIGWGGVYWQYPENNWGNLNDGIDLRWANEITFWARSDTPGTRVQFIVGGIGYQASASGDAICSEPIQPYPDSVCPKILLWEQLSTTWTKYTIDLTQYPRDFSRVIGGFGWVANTPVSFYLDDIVYEFDPSLGH